MQTWTNILEGPCWILNMDKCIDRWNVAQERVKMAGFRDVGRFRGLDAEVDDLETAWKDHGNPRFDPSDTEFTLYKGKQACALGHYAMWKKMIDERIPFVTVFEDDVEFHQHFGMLAPQYYENTPKDYDILYLGSQIEAYTQDHISRAPVFCTHAYVITYEGAKKLYSYCLKHAMGTRTIDCMLIDLQKQVLMSRQTNAVLTWYVWNANMFHDPARSKRHDWAKRNQGLVFQDADLGTYVRPW